MGNKFKRFLQELGAKTQRSKGGPATSSPALTLPAVTNGIGSRWRHTSDANLQPTYDTGAHAGGGSGASFMPLPVRSRGRRMPSPPPPPDALSRYASVPRALRRRSHLA